MYIDDSVKTADYEYKIISDLETVVSLINTTVDSFCPRGKI